MAGRGRVLAPLAAAAALVTAVLTRRRRRRAAHPGPGPGPGPSGVREPRRPLVPAASGAAEATPDD